MKPFVVKDFRNEGRLVATLEQAEEELWLVRNITSNKSYNNKSGIPCLWFHASIVKEAVEEGATFVVFRNNVTGIASYIPMEKFLALSTIEQHYSRKYQGHESKYGYPTPAEFLTSENVFQFPMNLDILN